MGTESEMQRVRQSTGVQACLVFRRSNQTQVRKPEDQTKLRVHGQVESDCQRIYQRARTDKNQEEENLYTKLNFLAQTLLFWIRDFYRKG